MDGKAQSWVEVIDPVTGRKVDITVSFHTDRPEHRLASTDDIDRITGYVVRAVTGKGIGRGEVLELSDLEYAARLMVSPYSGATHDETDTCEGRGCYPI